MRKKKAVYKQTNSRNLQNRSLLSRTLINSPPKEILNQINENNVNKCLLKTKKQSYTPLIFVLKYRNQMNEILDVVQSLIDVGADKNVIHIACQFNSDPNILACLLNNGAEIHDNREYTPLHYLCLGEFKETSLEFILQNKIPVDGIPCNNKKSYLTPLFFACQVNPNYELLEFLLIKKEAEFDIKDDNGNNMLHILAMNLDVSMFSVLLFKDKGLLEDTNNMKQTPFDLATKHKNMEFLKGYFELKRHNLKKNDQSKNDQLKKYQSTTQKLIKCFKENSINKEEIKKHKNALKKKIELISEKETLKRNLIEKYELQKKVKEKKIKLIENDYQNILDEMDLIKIKKENEIEKKNRTLSDKQEEKNQLENDDDPYYQLLNKKKLLEKYRKENRNYKKQANEIKKKSKSKSKRRW
ncbi:pote ankyrin domain [Anaeramoeba flamelloides]|uniref:Pote ankyrin domain n=1 Tax=Anaeramoeba flamelloides TaxID=1746091 RepID=A0ABQ8XV16_9EUKA|nr:pote ankyrin domain [Anaeramoeba flamelloides]